MDTVYDLIIIGSGPAGLTSAIYGGRAMLKTIVFEKENIGGRAFTTQEIKNYPGFKSISGPNLVDLMHKQAESFGVEFKNEQISKIVNTDNFKIVKTRKNTYTAKTIIVASGTSPKKLNIDGLDNYIGNGVAYCATCDAEFFKDQRVAVLGSGDQAIEESIYLTKFAKEVIIIVLHNKGILDCNKIAAKKAFLNKKISFIWDSTVASVYGDENFKGLVIKNLTTGNNSNLEAQGLFLFVGMSPNTNFIKDLIKLDENGWIITNELMETDKSGIYAAGDCRKKYLRQIATSVSDGAIAATMAEHYIDTINELNTRINNKESFSIIFWDSQINLSASELIKIKESYDKNQTLLEYDISKNRVLSDKYNIVLSSLTPIKVLNFINGENIS